ncbi:MAG: hypothetical protein H6R13_464 [Proteobacteria bacterium]|nr:hypothetical protein [Pseudomonadota bacterium]
MPKGLLVKLLLLVAIGAGMGAIAQIMLSPGRAPAVMFQPSGWSLLTDDEQKTLLPLADKWEDMGSIQQEKWRAIARKYPSLPLREQQKIQRRMTRWAGAAPEQRAIARQKFQRYKKKKPEEQERVRSAWRSHQTAKKQDTPVFSPSGNERPVNDGAVVKESENGSSFPQPDSGPATESPRIENEK